MQANSSPQQGELGAAAPSRRMPFGEALERLAGIQLANRFIWLVYALALYVLFQLSFIQWQSGTVFKHERFDTLQLAAHLMVTVEAALLLCAVLLAAGTPRVRQTWYGRFPESRFNYAASGLAADLCLVLLLALLLLPLLAAHSYPQLVEQGYNMPLMFMQRSVMLVFVLLTSFNVMQLLVLYLRLPWWLAAAGGACVHLLLGYAVTYFSFTTETLRRLNDVFYYNQLWQFIDVFPKLAREEVFANMQSGGYAYFTYYSLAAIGMWLITTLLWLPRAAMATSREKLPTGQPFDGD